MQAFYSLLLQIPNKLVIKISFVRLSEEAEF